MADIFFVSNFHWHLSFFFNIKIKSEKKKLRNEIYSIKFKECLFKKWKMISKAIRNPYETVEASTKVI